MTDIFESPDKGETIYVRQAGSIDRYLVKEDILIRDQVREQQLWHEIRIAARTNTTLADILDQAKMVYALIKKENN
jgi:histidinol-phosphate/aromatic aminotransferase/cobyric acid decarboxylase-like protein